MKSWFYVAVAVASLAAIPFATAETTSKTNNVCLDADHIVSTTVVDDRTVLYHMRGNVIWKNTLPRPCPGLKFQQGFSEEIRSGFVCSNTQMIRVLRTGAVCSLGPFTPYVSPEKHPS